MKLIGEDGLSKSYHECVEEKRRWREMIWKNEKEEVGRREERVEGIGMGGSGCWSYLMRMQLRIFDGSFGARLAVWRKAVLLKFLGRFCRFYGICVLFVQR